MENDKSEVCQEKIIIPTSNNSLKRKQTSGSPESFLFHAQNHGLVSFKSPRETPVLAKKKYRLEMKPQV